MLEANEEGEKATKMMAIDSFSVATHTRSMNVVDFLLEIDRMLFEQVIH
jgi:hypothetical protein